MASGNQSESLSENDLAEMRRGLKLAHSMPEVDNEIDDMIHFCIGQICHKAGRGVLTEQEALSYCMELYSYQRLKQRLQKKVAAADRLARSMSNG